VTEADGTSTTRFGWEGDRQVMEDIDGELTRTTIYEPESFVPLARIEMRPGGRDADPEAEAGQAEAQAMLSQLKHTLLGAGLALPKQLSEAIDAQGTPAARIGWFHTDHLGTPLALTGEQGELLWYASPDDWGAIAEAHGSVTQPIRFQGQYHDAESGLYYNRHRYYDPGMGRYISQDPIGFDGGMNFYTYVGGNPLSYMDPVGLLNPIAHFGLGYDAARNAGCGVLDSLAIGWATAATDWGTQGKSDAPIHAMTPANTDPSAAREKWRRYIDASISLGSKWELGGALHAAQDSHASGHKGFPAYDGFVDMIMNHPSHVVGDWLPSQMTTYRAKQASDAVMRSAGSCTCKC
jgi:RHS repeat-associated protein